jgi:hypothetical protein
MIKTHHQAHVLLNPAIRSYAGYRQNPTVLMQNVHKPQPEEL